MLADWMPRDDTLKDHAMTAAPPPQDPPRVDYELRPLRTPEGEVVAGLFVAWIILNNPGQHNSYTTEMVKATIAGFSRASGDRSVVAVVFTGTGDQAFCTGGNTVEYSQYYAQRPNEYGEYMDLFNAMVDSILNCKKPVICRVNGMRVAGGQEIGMACDLTLAADTAVFGQAGPRHGSAPVGGSTDFLPWLMTLEQAMWSCISCELWSAYTMQLRGLITEAVPVLKKDGRFIPNPLVETDVFLRDGRIVYGETKVGREAEEARRLRERCEHSFEQLDAAVDRTVWRLANLFPGCLQMSIDSIRAKKKFFWDQAKLSSRHWLAANMMGEALLGFTAFSTRKLTGRSTVDFLRYRQLIAAGARLDEALAEAVMPGLKASEPAAAG